MLSSVQADPRRGAATGGEMTKLSMRIEGMSCGHCVRAVREALDERPGVEVEQVTNGGAEVRYDPSSTTPERVADAVRDAGYEPALA